MKKEKIFTPRGFWEFANAVIGLFAGADRFIGVDDAEPEKSAESLPVSRHRLDHDENQPDRLKQS